MIFYRFEHVPLVTPNGDVLVKELNFEVHNHTHKHTHKHTPHTHTNHTHTHTHACMHSLLYS